MLSQALKQQLKNTKHTSLSSHRASHTHNSSSLRDFGCLKVDSQLSVLPLAGGARGVARGWDVLSRGCVRDCIRRGNAVYLARTGRGGVDVGGILVRLVDFTALGSTLSQRLAVLVVGFL